MLIYLGAMHLLVFITLYYSAHHVHYGCDPALDAIIHRQQQDVLNSATVLTSNAVSLAAAAVRKS